MPTALWEKEKYFSEEIKSDSIKIKIKLTPHFNFHKEQGVNKSEFGHIEIPISHVTKNGKRYFFLNGKATQADNTAENIKLIQMIRASLENNSISFNIEQKERRAIYLRNTNGFHARDVFEQPIEGVNLTRVLLRSVDVDAETYPSSKINITETNTLNYRDAYETTQTPHLTYTTKGMSL